MVDAEFIAVEVAYALLQEQAILTVQVPLNATIREAVLASKIQHRFPAINVDDFEAGIFSKLVKDLDKPGVLRAGDRIEIYRPLLADPKEVRKQRAAAAKERAQQG